MILSMDPFGQPETLISTATGTGLTKSTSFTISGGPPSGNRRLALQAKLTGAFTAFKVDLQQSLDGGLTYQTLQAAIDLFAAPVLNISVSPGFVYILNVSTFTGGTSADVVGASN